MESEWHNELRFILTPDEIKSVFRVLHKLTRQKRFQFSTFKKEIQYDENKSADIIQVLFDYSIIGHIDDQDRYYFRHRENPERPIEFELNKDFVCHLAILISSQTERQSGY